MHVQSLGLAHAIAIIILTAIAQIQIYIIISTQWNPSIMVTVGMVTNGTKDFGHYRGVATNQRFYKYYFNAVGTMVSGYYREGGLSSTLPS